MKLKLRKAPGRPANVAARERTLSRLSAEYVLNRGKGASAYNLTKGIDEAAAKSRPLVPAE